MSTYLSQVDAAMAEDVSESDEDEDNNDGTLVIGTQWDEPFTP